MGMFMFISTSKMEKALIINKNQNISPFCLQPDRLLRIPSDRTPDRLHSGNMPIYHDNKATDFI